MNRKELIKFVNEKVSPQVGLNFSFSPVETVKMIERWRIGRPANMPMTPDVMGGFLFINNIPVGRIASRKPRVTVSDGALFWEGRILARQEAVYC